MKSLSNKLWALVKTTFSEWTQDNAARLAAALAYYTIFSVAPLLVITIAIAGLALGSEVAQGQIVAQLRGLLGQQGAELIQGMIKSANKPTAGIVATAVSLITLLLGATGVFGELQSALNTIWNVKPKPQNGLILFALSRFWSLTMVLGIGFLLLVSLVLSAALSGIGAWMQGYVGEMAFIAQLINITLSFIVTTVLFALIYKLLPDLKIAWRDVWVGAVITALLFSIGRILIGFYLGNSAIGSSYGAAGSLVVVLVWVYYSAQILFLGAEFTQVYARTVGSRQSEGYLLGNAVAQPTPVIRASSPAVPSILQTLRTTQSELKQLRVSTPLVWLGGAVLVFMGVVQGLNEDRNQEV